MNIFVVCCYCLGLQNEEQSEHVCLIGLHMCRTHSAEIIAGIGKSLLGQWDCFLCLVINGNMFNYLWSVSLTYFVPQNLHLRVTLKNLNVENANIKVKYQHGLSLKQCKNIVDLIQNTKIIEQYAQLLGLLNWTPCSQFFLQISPKPYK